MKTLIVLLCVSFISCASIKYHDFEYSRFGNQELIGVELEQLTTEEGSYTRASLQSQKSEREIAEVLISMSENINKMFEMLERIVAGFPNERDIVRIP